MTKILIDFLCTRCGDTVYGRWGFCVQQRRFLHRPRSFTSVFVYDVNFLRRHDNAFSVCNCPSRLSFLASLSVSSRTNAERRTETGSLEQSSTSIRIDSCGICSYRTTEMTSVRQWRGAGHRRPHVSARQQSCSIFFRITFLLGLEKVSCVHAAHKNSHQMALIWHWPITQSW